MKNTIFIMLVAMLLVSSLADAANRKGSHRVGGHNSYGKGSHYIGGHK